MKQSDTPFPRSRKIHVVDGELRVPMREVTLDGDNPPVRLYDTTGPQGHDAADGIPRLRDPWTERRRTAINEITFVQQLLLMVWETILDQLALNLSLHSHRARFPPAKLTSTSH